MSNIEHRISNDEVDPRSLPSQGQACGDDSRTCENCRFSKGVWGLKEATLVCENKAGAGGKCIVVKEEGTCGNFEYSRDVVAPENARALAEGARLIPLTQDKYAIVDEEDTLADICDCFINNHFRRVAILSEGKLVSFISRLELIEANRYKFGRQNSPQEQSEDKNVFNAKDIMSYGLFTVKRETPLCEAVEILLKRDITGLPVVDDCMNLEGVITEKDILKVLYKPETAPGKVSDLMTTKTTTFDCNDSLFDICDCLINNSFRRVMILAHGKLTGIISRRDIIEFILKHKTDIDKLKPMD